MLQVKRIVVGSVRTNCYICYSPETLEGFIVDPGENAGDILAFIKSSDIKVKYIFVTHAHFDHVMALREVADGTGATVAASEYAAERIIKPENVTQSMLGLGGAPARTCRVDVVLRDGEKTQCAGEEIRMLSTPGHTPGSVCFDTGDMLFSGDTLFFNGCGRCDLPGGDYEAMEKSLRLLYNLPGDRRVYPGHEGATTLQYEREHNYSMLEAVRR